MAARALWKGVIEFEMVTVPVKLYTAVRPQGIHFRMLHDQDNVPVKQVLECPVEKKEIPREHVVKGYEVHRDQYVVVSEAEMDELSPVPSRTIKVMSFVDPAEIDPVYYEKAYWLGPDEHGEKSYSVLLRALTESKRAALVQFVMRGKEYFGAIRAMGNALCLETMRYGDEVVPVSEVLEGPVKTKLNERELKTAEQLIDALAVKFDPSQYHDEYRACVMSMIERKAAGEKIDVKPAKEKAATKAPDLIDVLKASIAATKDRAKNRAKKSA
jgi:DNA end-binding protein Ku